MKQNVCAIVLVNGEYQVIGSHNDEEFIANGCVSISMVCETLSDAFGICLGDMNETLERSGAIAIPLDNNNKLLNIMVSDKVFETDDKKFIRTVKRTIRRLLQNYYTLRKGFKLNVYIDNSVPISLVQAILNFIMYNDEIEYVGFSLINIQSSEESKSKDLRGFITYCLKVLKKYQDQVRSEFNQMAGNYKTNPINLQ